MFRSKTSVLRWIKNPKSESWSNHRGPKMRLLQRFALWSKISNHRKLKYEHFGVFQTEMKAVEFLIISWSNAISKLKITSSYDSKAAITGYNQSTTDRRYQARHLYLKLKSYEWHEWLSGLKKLGQKCKWVSKASKWDKSSKITKMEDKSQQLLQVKTLVQNWKFYKTTI